MFIFSPDKHFIGTRHVEYSELSDSGVILLDGVPPGKYTVVAFANIRTMESAKLVPGLSIPEELRLMLAFDKYHPTCDPILHHAGSYDVRRNAFRVDTRTMNKLFYRIELSVHGANSLDGFSIHFEGASAGYDFRGDRLGSVTYVPMLRDDGGVLKGQFFIPRFGRDDRVMMTLLAGTQKLAEMPLSDYLREHDVHIDLDARDVIIPIDIRLNTTHVTVVVNDWDEGAVQLPILGH